jgi:hypothetical protein
MTRTEELAAELKAAEARLSDARARVSEARIRWLDSKLDDTGLRDHVVSYESGRRSWTGVVRSMSQWGNYVDGYKIKKDGTPGLHTFSENPDRLQDLGPYVEPTKEPNT